MKLHIFGAVCAYLFVAQANAAVIHTYEFGNTANGGPDSGTLIFSSEGTAISAILTESDYGELKATINGDYYDFSNIDGPGGGWTQISERYIYTFTGSTNRIFVYADLVKGAQTLQYSVRTSLFDEPTGFGVGDIEFRECFDGCPSGSWTTYTAEVGYLHTTSPIPVPTAVWLFGSGLIGLIGIARRKKS